MKTFCISCGDTGFRIVRVGGNGWPTETTACFCCVAIAAGWKLHANGMDWVSPCGEFIESSAKDACKIDGLEVQS